MLGYRLVEQRAFGVDAANYDVKVLMWQTIIHGVFLLSALAIAYTDKLLGTSESAH